MVKLKLVLPFVLLSLTVYSQSGWVTLNYGNPSSGFSDVFFLNENTGFVIGAGRILKTTNAGLNWANTFLGGNTVFRSIHSFNGNIIVAVGAQQGIFFLNPVIYKSDNGGNSWSFNFGGGSYYQANSYTCVSFKDENTAFVVGGLGLIYKTTNSANSWQQVYLNLNPTFFNVQFLNSQTGYLQGQYDLLKTINGGNNWLPVSGGGETLFFIDVNTGYQTYFSRLYRTTNGGSAWQMLPLLNTFIGVWDLFFNNYYTGYAVGGSGNTGLVLIKTMDAGYNWYSQYDSTNGNLSSIQFVNENTGYCVGDFTNGVILKTTTGGRPIGIQPKGTEIPSKFSLSQNYPNPFNPTSKIKFDIPFIGAQYIEPVQLIVYDILGREIAMLVNEELKPGSYEVELNASNFPSGTYFYRLQSRDYTETKKMVLIK